MNVVASTGRVRRGARRLVLAICALILGAGFTPALPPSDVDTRVTVSVVAAAHRRAAPPVAEPAFPAAPPAPGTVAVPAAVPVAVRVLSGVVVEGVAGRAPPSISV